MSALALTVEPKRYSRDFGVICQVARGSGGEQSATAWDRTTATPPSAGQCPIVFPRMARFRLFNPAPSNGAGGRELSYWPGAWQSLGVKLDFRVVDVPFGILVLDPHKRDIER